MRVHHHGPLSIAIIITHPAGMFHITCSAVVKTAVAKAQDGWRLRPLLVISPPGAAVPRDEAKRTHGLSQA